MATRTLTSRLVTAYAVLLAASGGMLLFVPEALLGGEASPQSLLPSQLVGAALLGFGVMGWTARGLVLGGIYGRAVVAGLQAFTFVATLVLLSSRPPTATLAYWLLLGLLALGAVLFSILLFRPGLLSSDD